MIDGLVEWWRRVKKRERKKEGRVVLRVKREGGKSCDSARWSEGKQRLRLRPENGLQCKG